jgi:predicted RNA-binding Zn ribbon-like protein
MSEIPEDLELIRSFVNTAELDEDIDELATPASLRDWIREHELGDGPEPSEEDRRRVIAVREALRALLLANGGEPLDPGAVEALNSAAAPVALKVRFGDDAQPELSPAGKSIDAALGTILAAVVKAMADGTWPRLKACREDTCQWAFYDRSRNRSGQWCSMAVCGNRAKARAYRHRHKEEEKQA